MDHYAADAAAVVEHLGLRDAVHVGHSTGGGEAARYVARHGRGRAISPNRRLPANASRTTSIDHRSPTASRDRATGHTSFSKLLRFMGLTPIEELFHNRLQGATTLIVYPGSCKTKPPRRRKP